MNIRIRTYVSILAISAFLMLPIIAKAEISSPFIVNTTDDIDDETCDESHCSLREAINAANANPSVDTIVFNLPDPSFTIQPESALPDITDPVTIDGTSQPGYSDNPIIELNGSAAGYGVNGLVISASESTVRGLVINGFSGNGIVLTTGGVNIIEDNFIGTDVTGSTTAGPVGPDPGAYTPSVEFACPTYDQGVDFDGFVSESGDPLAPWSGTSVTFKGTDECESPETLGESSLIYRYQIEFVESTPLTSIVVTGVAFNGSDSILRVLDAGMNVLGVADTFGDNSFQTHYIVLEGVEGTRFYVEEYDTSTTWRFRQSIVINGAVPLGNLGFGVFLGGGASDNLIASNLISGNGSDGVAIFNPGTSGNMLQGNLVGTDVSGNIALPNAGAGIWIGEGATDTLVGGVGEGEGNLISGNRFGGVSINHLETTGTYVQGNKIGTNQSGDAVLANGGDGVFISASQSVIGGEEPGAGNLISGNAASGVGITEAGSGNLVQGNFIGTDANGNAALPNAGVGVWIGNGATDTLVGGVGEGEGNLISGNGSGGVSINHLETTGTYVQGNKIGTNQSGDTVLANGGDGVFISASQSLIGGEEPGAGNLISGNVASGISIVDAGSSNLVQGNYIGTDVTGSTTAGPVGPDPGAYTPSVDFACPTYDQGMDFDGFVSESGDPLASWSGTSVTFKGTDECESSETLGESSLIYRYQIEFDGSTPLTSIVVTGAAFNGPDSILRVLDADMNVLGVAGTFGDNSFQTHYIVLEGVEGTRFYVEEYDTSSTWRFRQSIVVNGAVPLGNRGFGVVLGGEALDNLIANNLISGNGSDGVAIFNPGTSGNMLQGNLVGTDVSGNIALPNAGVGVWIGEGATDTLVGGVGEGEGNLISGNRFGGVSINHLETTGTYVQGNKIGTNQSGDASLPNGGDGVFISASQSVIGGEEPGAGNLISGNAASGVGITDAGSSNLVQGNYIGTDVTGSTTTGPVGPDPGAYTPLVDFACPTYDQGMEFDGFVSESGDPLASWSGTSVTFKGTDECESSETLGESSLIYRYQIDFNESTPLTSIVVSGAAFNGPDSILRVLDADMNVLGVVGTFGDNSFQTHYIVLEGVEGTRFYVEEYDTSSTWRFRQSIVVNGGVPLGNLGFGVFLGGGASDNVIANNLISGNGSDGVAMFNPGTSGNMLQGNLVGTDVSGNAALPNAGAGIWIGEGVTDTLVGGVGEGEGNLISGNGGDGVSINDSETSNTILQGNFIGTDLAGTAPLPNMSIGIVLVNGTHDNLVGGTISGSGNVISGNSAYGVAIFDPGTTGNILQGNYIGTDASGAISLGNLSGGIFIANGATGNLIGGIEPGAGNTIAFNSDAGIALNVEAGSGNALLSNLVFSNGGLGIDLGEDGVTLNDRGDQDAGPNDLQNYPNITAVTSMDTSVLIHGWLVSTPSTNFRLEFFSNGVCDPSIYGEGQTFLGFDYVTTNRAGFASFNIILPMSLPRGTFITATATDPQGSTSEFSRCTSTPPQSASLWVATYTFDLSPGYWAEGVHPYHFEFEWSLPEPGKWVGQGGELMISNDAPLYDGYVLLRGFVEMGRVVSRGNPTCEEVELVHPDQPTRFLIGWLADLGDVTYPQARAHFESLIAKVVWNDGTFAELVPHEIRPFSFERLDKWFDYVCTYAVRE